MARYEIAFSAQLVPGAELALVKANLAKLFQADEQRIALLFSGRRIVIKTNLDEAGAEKYRSTLERAGAVAEVVNLDVEVEEIELAAAPEPVSDSPVPAVAEQSVPKRLQVAPRDEYMAAFSDVEAPDFGIAALGDDLQDDRGAGPAPPAHRACTACAPGGGRLPSFPGRWPLTFTY